MDIKIKSFRSDSNLKQIPFEACVKSTTVVEEHCVREEGVPEGALDITQERMLA